MTLTPAVAYAIAAAIFYLGYRIEETDVTQMQDEITARKIRDASLFSLRKWRNLPDFS
jgi:Na+/melibiose symporter-like transporter